MPLEICTDDLPPTARLIAEIIGLTKALQIIDEYGGSRIHFPMKGLNADHPIREILDDIDCIQLSRYFIGTINVPRARSAKAVAKGLLVFADHQNGLTLRQLSRKYNLCERQINNVVKKQRNRINRDRLIQEKEKTTQLSLF